MCSVTDDIICSSAHSVIVRRMNSSSSAVLYVFVRSDSTTAVVEVAAIDLTVTPRTNSATTSVTTAATATSTTNYHTLTAY
eukprot:10116-Heterococcus_DN1.PRE.3